MSGLVQSAEAETPPADLELRDGAAQDSGVVIRRDHDQEMQQGVVQCLHKARLSRFPLTGRQVVRGTAQVDSIGGHCGELGGQRFQEPDGSCQVRDGGGQVAARARRQSQSVERVAQENLVFGLLGRGANAGRAPTAAARASRSALDGRVRFPAMRDGRSTERRPALGRTGDDRGNRV